MHDVESPDDDSRVLDAVRAKLGATCGCGAELGGEDLIYSVALGFKDAPRCLPRLAEGLARPASDLQAELGRYVARQECYRRAWAAVESWAERRRTRCSQTPRGPLEEPTPAKAAVENYWDAGDMSCGDLVLALRKRLAGLQPGATLTVRALDSAAPLDLPAWCKLTGNPLRSADHPTYVIARRET